MKNNAQPEPSDESHISSSVRKTALVICRWLNAVQDSDFYYERGGKIFYYTPPTVTLILSEWGLSGTKLSCF